jgi:hypothetical protein
MIIYPIETEKWLSLPLAGEVREEVNTMMVDNILRELGQEPNSENRFEFKAKLLNRFIEEEGLNLPEEQRDKMTKQKLHNNIENIPIEDILKEIGVSSTECKKCIVNLGGFPMRKGHNLECKCDCHMLKSLQEEIE